MPNWSCGRFGASPFQTTMLSKKTLKNDKIAGSGQVEHAKEAARSRRSKQLPAKHQVAENTLRQKQEQAHPDLPRTVDFVVFAYDF